MDNRRQRHLATRDDIVAAAWRLSGEHGLTGWSLRELAGAVGVRAPSLYVYFTGKDQIYDEMFSRSYSELLEQSRILDLPNDPIGRLRAIAYWFFDFAVANPARLQLMFWRVVPGFEPSEGSYAVSRQVMELFEQRFFEVGIAEPAALDTWTAMLSGLVTQQMSNEPGGDRWRRLLDQCVEMFAREFVRAG
ncbi:TetR/AcrR family transcriptional regulator [Antrihabitans sp. YC2-6]|uniref:TetR/AcrR family transcriptional regulator n=1 Tax=Antrihabitans sp. YC2-6 TaxID=2799498 RepID=UPI0018F7977F|nr:TetR/AcrR family transcriptional regulator [Antrihabitans sp. YC2-6]MBJ8343720.1 TetR/AcrR family transcriptional regulator [Antrihabitans sp. YC2-6]